MKKQSSNSKPTSKPSEKTAADVADAYKYVGERIRSWRESQVELSVADLAEALRRRDPLRKGISPSQINRIERGLIMPDLREVGLLASFFGKRLDELWEGDVPAFKIDANRADDFLKKVRRGEASVNRTGKEHEFFIKQGIYEYVPLNADEEALVPPDNSADYRTRFVPKYTPWKLQKYLFQINEAPNIDPGDQAEIRKFIGRAFGNSETPEWHTGEEIVFIIQGRVRFWYQNRPTYSSVISGDTAELRYWDLGPGDSVQYSSEILHAYLAIGGSAKALFVYTGTERRQVELGD